jgi:ferrous iron transport protein B
MKRVEEAKLALEGSGIPSENMRDRIVARIVKLCESICREAVIYEKDEYAERDRRIDKILTSKLTGIPIMIVLLSGVFWLTITGANYPSALLAKALLALEGPFSRILLWLSSPEWLRGLVVRRATERLLGCSFMLPPMAKFLPPVNTSGGYRLPASNAFNLITFSKACAHGKPALTMCMALLQRRRSYRLPYHRTHRVNALSQQSQYLRTLYRRFPTLLR